MRSMRTMPTTITTNTMSIIIPKNMFNLSRRRRNTSIIITITSTKMGILAAMRAAVAAAAAAAKSANCIQLDALSVVIPSADVD